MLGMRVHPRRLVMGRKTEDCVGDEKIMGGAGFQQEESIAVSLTCAVLSQHIFQRPVLSPNTGIEIAENDELKV